MKKKVCKRCDVLKPLDAFLKKTNHKKILCKDKTRDVCKQCSIGIDWKYATDEQKLEKIRQTFEKYVIRNGDYCWKWKGCITTNGYAAISVYRDKRNAHRISWLIHNGKIPIGKYVCHKCDNKECTNPDHLFIGTNRDNQQDLVRKGKNNNLRGNRAPWSKLTEKQVREIYKLFYESITLDKIAKIYKVSRATISHIKNGKSWKHVKI